MKFPIHSIFFIFLRNSHLSFTTALVLYKLQYSWSQVIQNINNILAFFRPHFRAVSVTKSETIYILSIKGTYTAQWVFASKAGSAEGRKLTWVQMALLKVFLETSS